MRIFFNSCLLFIHMVVCGQSEIFERHIATNGSEILQDFAEFLSIPNVAADLRNINLNADYLKDKLQERNVQVKLLRMIGAPPIVYGYYPVKGATRTLGIYVHYDGQPVDKTEWKHDPWDPRLYNGDMANGGKNIDFPQRGDLIDKEWRIYARSAGDDKAPITAILAAIDAINQSELSISSNLVFFFEGQEEAGSRQLLNYLNDYSSLFEEIDIWLFCDGPVHQSRRPQLVMGVRGVTGLEVTVYGPNRGLHSGHYGNWAPVPGQLMANLLSSMKDESGNVMIDGFYDDVEELTVTEKAAIDAIPDIDEQLKKELGLMVTEGKGNIYERMLYPSLTIKGLKSGNVGAEAANVIPAVAIASLGIRLVKGNDPEKMIDLVEEHIREQGFHIVREDPTMEMRLQYPKIAKVIREQGYPAARTTMNDPMAQKIIVETRKIVGDELIILPTLGGTLPLYYFTDILKKPAIVVPIANHDNNQHAANENLRLENLWYGIRLFGGLMTMN